MQLVISKIERIIGDNPNTAELHVTVIMNEPGIVGKFLCNISLKATAPIPNDLEARCEERIRSLISD
jgi:hypothetical protein